MSSTVSEGDLVTGRTSHEIYVIREGKRRWVPDSWTLNAEGLSTSQLRIVDEDELEKVPLGDALPSSVPPPALTNGEYVETEDGVFEVVNSKLNKVLDPRELVQNGKPPDRVTFLSASLVRSLYNTQEVS